MRLTLLRLSDGHRQAKLENRQYFSVEDFVYDFHQLFANIFKYYAETHPAYHKARELSQLFEARMAAASTKFR